MAKFQTAVQMLYPPRCLGCGGMVESDFGLCGSCWGQTPFVGGAVCDACGVPLPGPSRGETLTCDDCMSHPRPWRHGRAAMLYKDHARKIVLALKHGDRAEVARPAARWMKHAGQEIFLPDMLIAPVPLHWTRLMKRRYNQSALLAHALARETKMAICPDLLLRTRQTESLDGKGKAERFSTLDRAITWNPKRRHRMVARSVLLIDDVMTSGATLAAATEACLAGGARDICVLTLARVAKDA